MSGMEIFYDGDCVFCNSYIRLRKLQAAAGSVELISIRSHDPRVRALEAQGYRLNLGMAVRYGGKVYYGHRAMALLARMERAGEGGLAMLVFKLLYPLLVFGRMVTLYLLGRSLYTPRMAGFVPAVRPRLYRLFRLSFVVMPFFAAGLLALTLHLANANGAIDGLARLLSDARITLEKVSEYFSAPAAALLLLYSTAVSLVFYCREDWARRIYDGMLEGRVGIWIVYGAITLAAVNCIGAVPTRRLVFCTYMLVPMFLLIGVARTIWRDRKRGGRTAAFLVTILALVIGVPGFFLPPFSDGIAGWTYPARDQKQFRITGYKLIRKDGAERRYASILFNPVTQRTRFKRAYIARTSKEDFEAFMISHYKWLYPDILSKGLLPHTAIFHTYGYPGHNRYAPISYADFPPESIVALEEIEEVWGADGTLISKTMLSHHPFN